MSEFDGHQHACVNDGCVSAQCLCRQTYTTTKQFEPEEIATFLDICGDDNPIHFDFELAQAAGEGLELMSTQSTRFAWRQGHVMHHAGFQGILLPGLLCASLFPGLIGTAFPGAVYVSQELRFRRPALVCVCAHSQLVQQQGFPCISTPGMSCRHQSLCTRWWRSAQSPGASSLLPRTV